MHKDLITRSKHLYLVFRVDNQYPTLFLLDEIGIEKKGDDKKRSMAPVPLGVDIASVAAGGKVGSYIIYLTSSWILYDEKIQEKRLVQEV